MKIISGFLAIAATVMITACGKETTPPLAPTPTEGGKVEISFVSTATAKDSRAFGAGTTETWEKMINNATVLVFDAAGKIKFRRDLSSVEIANAKTTPVSLVIPGVAVGENCDFAVIANRTVPTSVTTKALLLAEEENDAAAYNGTFADATTKPLRASGFVMTGMATQIIVNGTTDVSLTLKRLVAKIEMTTATTQAFRNKYGNATVTVMKVTLSRGALKSYLMDKTPSEYAGSGVTFSQEQASSAGKNLFYTYEKATASVGARTLLTIDAIYDADGLSATLNDQVPVSYQVELTGTTDGKILRNGSYLLNVAIDGLTGKDISLSVSVADWETLTTNEIHVGN